MELSDRQLVVLKLDEYGLTQKWLMLRLRRRKEEVTVSSLSDALSGRRNSERCKTIVRLSLEEIKNYHERMEGDTGNGLQKAVGDLLEGSSDNSGFSGTDRKVL